VKPGVRLQLVLLCFLLSGFAALLYQTVWTRLFAFVFGTSELAVATVLAAYMGGLSAGAAVAARLASRVRRPVLVYALLELGIALCALAVPAAIRAATALLVRLLGGAPELPASGGLTTALFFVVCAFAILLVPTALMGATLPLLARHAVQRESEIGSRVGLLYAVNTAGAVAGTLLAAFLLLPRLGLRGATWSGVAANGLVFLLAALLARGAPAVATGPAVRVERAAGRAGWILPLAALAGVTSFTYEVLWTRLLGHVLGGSVYAFATMLASFLVGIAAGSAVAARFANTRERSAAGFALAELGVAALSVLAFRLVDRLPGLIGALGAERATDPAPSAAVAAAVLLPSALCIGATFPFAVRVLARSEADAGPATARVFAWNTLGAIVGAVGAGFLWIPALGYSGALRAAALLNVAIAAGVLALGPASRARMAAIAAAAVAVALAPLPTPWQVLRASPFAVEPAEGEVAYYAVGRAATVLLLDDLSGWQLRTNGLPEASIQRRGDTASRHRLETWLGVLPAMARPEARSLLLIGLGGGQAAGQVPSTFEQVEVVELEPEVVEANRAVAAGRLDHPLSDPRLRVTANDARGGLLLTERRYDAVVSQPSHPWTAGSAHLYTREFFALVRDHLDEDGVFVQWIGLSFVDETLLRSLLATLLDVFPHVRLYRPVPTGLLFLASAAPLDVEASVSRALAAAPDDLAAAGVFDPEDAAAALALDEEGTRDLARGAPVSRDEHNLLAIRSPRMPDGPLRARGADRVLEPFHPGERLLDCCETLLLLRRMATASNPAAPRLAAAITDPGEAAAAQGFLALARQRPAEAERWLRAALRLDPGLADALQSLVLLRHLALAAGPRDGDLPLERLAAPAAAVVEGWERERAADWAGIRDLDADLAALQPRDPLHPEAARLRAAWRLRAGGDAAEGLAILDRISITLAHPGLLLLRSRLALAAGFPEAAVANLSDALRAGRRRPEVAREALAVLDEIPPAPGLDAYRARLRERLLGALR
jgi:spermidine synthase